MFSVKTVDVRPNWEKRISTKGLNPDRWQEGSMVVVGDSPTSLVEALMDFVALTRQKLNDLFAACDSSVVPDFEGLNKEAVFNAAASSWAHQDVSFPLRFDIGLTDKGTHVLLAVKGDYLEGMIVASSVSKAWHEHHFDGLSIGQVNSVPEHFSIEMTMLGKHSSPPMVEDVTILASNRMLSEYISSCAGPTSGVELSSVGISGLDDISKVLAFEKNQKAHAVIKIDPWKDILGDCAPESPWYQKFQEPRSFMLQPAWVLALDEMVDINTRSEEDQIVQVMNVWMSIDSNAPIPLVVSSEYKENYRFEDSVITPVVIDFQKDLE